MNTAYEQLVEGEIETARMLLETEDRKVLLVAIASTGDDVTLCRSVSGDCTRLNAVGFIQALEREISRLKGIVA